MVVSLARVGIWLAAAGLFGGLLAACAQPVLITPGDDRPAPELAVTGDKPGDRVAVTADPARAVLEIWSASGIGGARVDLVAGSMPPQVLLRLHLAGLEQLTFDYGDALVQLSVSSSDGLVQQSVVQAGQESQITSASPYWMEVARPAAADAPFLVTSPPAFAASAADYFTVEWIDFYR